MPFSTMILPPYRTLQSTLSSTSPHFNKWKIYILVSQWMKNKKNEKAIFFWLEGNNLYNFFFSSKASQCDGFYSFICSVFSTHSSDKNIIKVEIYRKTSNLLWSKEYNNNIDLCIIYGTPFAVFNNLEKK